MQFFHISTLFLGIAGLCAAATSCAADNCYRQVKASAFTARPTVADCSKFVATSTATIPVYASGCSNAAKYSSACSCIGVTPTPAFTRAPACDPAQAYLGAFRKSSPSHPDEKLGKSYLCRWCRVWRLHRRVLL